MEMPMNFDIAFIGFGTVGRGLADLLLEKKELLKKDYGLEWRVVAISDIKAGSIMDDQGIDLKEALRLADSRVSLETMQAKRKGLSALETIGESPANTIVEVTWTNITDGEPGYSHLKSALSIGKHVVTTNKGPIALHYRELVNLAKKNSVSIKFKGTVLSGTPVFNLFDGALAACTVSSIRGILNGTTNFILSEMEKGREYPDVLKQAQGMGFAEADPTMDVEGWDAAAKLAILANYFFGIDAKPSTVRRKGITGISPSDINDAREKNERIKLIANAARVDGGVDLEVAPTRLPMSNPLANIPGVTNALTFSTDCLGDVTIVGPGAGRRATGYSLLTDIISISHG
jgi:homoserine dehydrogenase